MDHSSDRAYALGRFTYERHREFAQAQRLSGLSHTILRLIISDVNPLAGASLIQDRMQGAGPEACESRALHPRPRKADAPAGVRESRRERTVIGVSGWRLQCPAG